MSEMFGPGMYDLAMIGGKLYRVQCGSENIIMRAPLPAKYWSLPRYKAQPCTSKLHVERLAVFARFVYDLTSLSKCSDKHTAAIITDNIGSQVYSIGINGGPKGGLNCLCNTGTKYTCIHAEQNAIAKCTVADKDKLMICSYSPCVTCAALIVNSGFSEVYYLEEYKDKTGLEILRDAGIKVYYIKDILGGE